MGFTMETSSGNRYKDLQLLTSNPKCHSWEDLVLMSSSSFAYRLEEQLAFCKKSTDREKQSLQREIGLNAYQFASLLAVLTRFSVRFQKRSELARRAPELSLDFVSYVEGYYDIEECVMSKSQRNF